MFRRPPHPLDHHPSFRAVVEAAPPLADLAAHLPRDVLGSLMLSCCELVTGFQAPLASAKRARAHHRAWVGVREIDRQVAALGRRRAAPAELVASARRAVDRADVLISALLP